MKIISKGVTKKGTCPTCFCKFEYDQSDIQYVYGLLFGKTEVVYCPECNERIDERLWLVVNSLGHLK